jgi:hypothetical protein
MAAILGDIVGGIGSIGGDIISNSGGILSGLGSGVESALGGVGTVFSDVIGANNSSEDDDFEFYLLLAGVGFLLYEFFNSGGGRQLISLSPEGDLRVWYKGFPNFMFVYGIYK